MTAVPPEERSGSLLAYRGRLPIIAPDAFIAPGAKVIGDVVIGSETGIWFNAVLRGDVNEIRIGARTNLQDGCVVHVSSHGAGTYIGSDVTIGHMALLHACTVEDGAFIGMHATVLDDAVVESGAMVAAGALVTPGKRVKAGELWAGSPARPMRSLSPEERRGLTDGARRYVLLGREYREALKSP